MLDLQATPLAVAVSSFAAATFDRWIYVIGGGPNGKLATDQVQRWEPGKDCWEMRAPIPVETKCTNAVTFSSCIYVVGRRVSPHADQSHMIFFFIHRHSRLIVLFPGGAMHAMYCYSPLSDSWSLITRLGERASCAIAACNNKLFITGGRDNKNQVISTVMCWDVDRAVLTEECILPMGVSHHGSVILMKSYTHIHKIMAATETK